MTWPRLGPLVIGAACMRLSMLTTFVGVICRVFRALKMNREDGIWWLWKSHHVDIAYRWILLYCAVAAIAPQSSAGPAINATSGAIALFVQSAWTLAKRPCNRTRLVIKGVLDVYLCIDLFKYCDNTISCFVIEYIRAIKRFIATVVIHAADMRM